MRLHFTYRGVIVFRATTPGHGLRWSARTDTGVRLAADTQAQMRALIRAEEKP